jgi:hydrogenase-4 component E
MSETLFSQLANLLSGAILVTALFLLWRRTLSAYIDTFVWQSVCLVLLTAVAAFYTHRTELFLTAVAITLIKVISIPWLLRRVLRTIERKHDQEHKEFHYVAESGAREADPYVNIPTSVLIGGCLIVIAYLVIGPATALSDAPTRSAMPLGLAVIFVGLFMLISRKKALSQVMGFLVLENGIALLAVLATYGVPLIVEMGATLDLLLGFLVMQVFLYRIGDTFVSPDTHEMTELRD